MKMLVIQSMKNITKNMKQTELKGIITPILTPMNADESINTDELRTQDVYKRQVNRY